MNTPTSTDVLKFWFEELTEKDWFASNPELDARIRERFLGTHAYVAHGNSVNWRTSIFGRLAEIIVLDQFSRNIFRGTPDAFAYDGQALTLTEDAIRIGADQELPEPQRAFLYMPFMHSEVPNIHARAMTLFASLKEQSWLTYEMMHKEIIDRFGRYPHRNAILNRPSTEEELEFLKTNKGF